MDEGNDDDFQTRNLSKSNVRRVYLVTYSRADQSKFQQGKALASRSSPISTRDRPQKLVFNTGLAVWNGIKIHRACITISVSN